MSERLLKALRESGDFQAEYEGSIPFTRSILGFSCAGCLAQAGRAERPAVAGVRYCGFVDPSGGSADAMTLAIGHRDGELCVLDCLREVRPPFSPKSVVAEFAQLLTSYACLKHCQAPLNFIQQHGGFRRDALGSLGVGFRHGLYRVGCCWALMALLFVGGVMNIIWIAGLTIFVLLEKVVPLGRVISRIAGVGQITWGALLLFAALQRL